MSVGSVYSSAKLLSGLILFNLEYLPSRDDRVALVRDETGGFRVRSSGTLCFLYLTNSEVVARYPVSRVLVPVVEDGAGGFVSGEIEVLKEIVEERIVKHLNFVAIFLNG